MARILGKQNKYLIWKAVWHAFCSLLLIEFFIFLVLWLILFLFFNKQGLHNLFNFPLISIIEGLFILLLVPLLLAYFVYKKYKTADQFSLNYINGWRGEKKTIKYLSEVLPETFTIFPHIKLSNKKWDIDCVVVGPTGVFTLEIKSHRGVIGWINSWLTKNGYPVEKDFIKQASGQADGLKKYLLQQLGIEFFVNPLVIFSSEDAILRLGMRTLGGVNIIKNDWLKKVIMDTRSVIISSDNLKSIIGVIEKLNK